MKKRFLALLFALSLSVCMCVSVFAVDTGIDIIDDPLSYYFQNQLLGVQKGTGVTLVCPNGDYKTLYTGGTLVTCPYDGEALELASAGGVIAKKIPEGIGRKDIIGYQDNKGTPNISSDGILYTLAVPYGIVNVDNTAFYTKLNTSYNYVLGSSGSGTSGSSSVSFVYTFTVPETGLYYLYNTTGLSLGSYQIFQDGKSWNEYLKSPEIFYRYSSSKTFEKLILNKTRYYLKKIINHKTKVELTKQLEFLVEMTARALVDMIILEIESEMPVKKEILLDWLMNGMSKEISDLVEDYEVPMTVVKRWKM